MKWNLKKNVRLYFLDNKSEIIEKKGGKIFLNIEECDIKVILCKAIKLEEKKISKNSRTTKYI